MPAATALCRDLRLFERGDVVFRMRYMLRSFVKRVQAMPVARNSFWMFMGFGLRLVVQAAYFVFIARALGVVQYGAFVGVTAFVQILAPFCGLGSGSILVKNVSRDRSSYAMYWGKALGTTLATGVLLFLVTLPLKRLVLSPSVSWHLLILVGLSDIIAIRVIEVAGQAFQAIDSLKQTAQLNLLPNVIRLLGAAFAFFYLHRISASQWGWFYLASTGLSAVVAVLVTRRRIGPPDHITILRPREMLEGSYFSTSIAAQTLYNDLDKTMLARMSTLQATGIYAVAYRFVDVSFTPIRSVLYATYCLFFSQRRGWSAGNIQVPPAPAPYLFRLFAPDWNCALCGGAIDPLYSRQGLYRGHRRPEMGWPFCPCSSRCITRQPMR